VNRGVTILEVLTLAALTGLLSGVGYIATEGAREKGREHICASNLHQIYVGLSIYSADNAGPEQLPGLGSIKLVPQVTALSPYVPRGDFYCPNTPPKIVNSHRFWSTYELAFVYVAPKGSKGLTSYVNHFKDELKAQGPQTPLAICNMHDETYYGPREQSIDPDLARPFQLHLQLDGSIAANRFPGRRHRSFTIN